MTRINGAEEFAKLSPEEQMKIGGLAIEAVAAWIGQDAHDPQSPDAGEHAVVLSRAFERADSLCADVLQSAVEMAVGIADDGESDRPLPSVVGEVCGTCGCTQFDACYPGERWARVATEEEEALCQACADKAGADDVG